MNNDKFQAYIHNVYKFYGYGMYGLFLKNGKMIGMAGFNNTDYGIELGYIIDRKYRRNGYAYEACKRLLEFARDYYLSDEMICTIKADNTSSQRLCRKLEFIQSENFGGTNPEILVFKKEL